MTLESSARKNKVNNSNGFNLIFKFKYLIFKSDLVKLKFRFGFVGIYIKCWTHAPLSVTNFCRDESWYKCKESSTSFFVCLQLITNEVTRHYVRKIPNNYLIRDEIYIEHSILCFSPLHWTLLWYVPLFSFIPFLNNPMKWPLMARAPLLTPTNFFHFYVASGILRSPYAYESLHFPKPKISCPPIQKICARIILLRIH